MQKAVELEHNDMVLRGMEHIPDKGTSFPAVILFHGFTGNRLEPHRLFLKISRALASRGIASFRFDFAGSGESDGDFEDMTLSAEVSDAHAILDHVKQDPRIDSEKVSLLGLSMGGLVASLVAGDRPNDIDRLILMAPAGDWMKKIADERQAETGKEVYDHDGNLVGRGFAEDLKSLDTYPRAANFDGKVLLIHGSEDRSVPAEVSHQYQQQSYGTNAAVRIIEGADHTFNRHSWEQDVIRHVCSFFAANSDR
ncbi:MAG TPA: alpha/beta fold hydrolase [Bacillales bacterium]|nr:alpha/beta fold hydrolase [Bacillales bacterium]